MVTLQQVINSTLFWKDFLHPGSHKVISLIQACHTHHLGYHHCVCTNIDCNHSYYQYHSCGNRHCPGSMGRVCSLLNNIMKNSMYDTLKHYPNEAY